MVNKSQLKEIAKRRNGVFTRVSYQTDITDKLNARTKKAGIRVIKIVNTTGRFGCNYGNLKRVIERKANEEPKNTTRSDLYEWVIPNKIKRHKEKGTEYLVMNTIPSYGANTYSKYIVYDGDNVNIYNSISEIADMFQPSYVNGNKERPDVISIKMENILSFNNVS